MCGAEENQRSHDYLFNNNSIRTTLHDPAQRGPGPKSCLRGQENLGPRGCLEEKKFTPIEASRTIAALHNYTALLVQNAPTTTNLYVAMITPLDTTQAADNTTQLKMIKK